MKINSILHPCRIVHCGNKLTNDGGFLVLAIELNQNQATTGQNSIAIMRLPQYVVTWAPGGSTAYEEKAFERFEDAVAFARSVAVKPAMAGRGVYIARTPSPKTKIIRTLGRTQEWGCGVLLG